MAREASILLSFQDGVLTDVKIEHPQYLAAGKIEGSLNRIYLEVEKAKSRYLATMQRIQRGASEKRESNAR